VGTQRGASWGVDRVRSRPHQRLQILDDRPESNRPSSKDFDACVARGSVI
jgi:hypothetical protein